jgi:NADP-reducing hydrogenase subunit HndD
MIKKVFITINNKKYPAEPTQTILDVCLANHIFVPTLCKHPDLSIQGKCRICLVEVEGLGIVTSCSTPPEDGMKIKTDTPAVKRARAVNLEMIYAEHIEKCSACIQEHSCLLKDYAAKYGLKLTRFKDRKGKLPIWHFGKKSSQELKTKIEKVKRSFVSEDVELRSQETQLHAHGYIQFDSSKCIDCGICTEVCRYKQTCDFYETIGKGSGTQTKPTDNKNKDCTYCGQCVVHCPVGAIQGVPHWPAVEELLKNKEQHKKTLVAQIAPSIRVSIGEEFHLDYGQVVTGQLAASMRALGFDAVFDVTVGADFTTYEEARELVEWLGSNKDRPMLTSCCPGWVKFVEFYYPDFVPHLTTARSPHLHSGILAKTYWAELVNKKPEDIILVSIMPCTAKKQEIALARHQFKVNSDKKEINIPIVDYVLTTREYAYLLRRFKIDFAQLKPASMDNPLGKSSGAGVIYGASGGVMESALRSADYFLRVKKQTGSLESVLCGGCKDIPHQKSFLSQNRINFNQVRGQEGIKSAKVKVGDTKLKVAVANGLGNARMLLEDIKNKKCHYDYIEVMACPGGCIGGGGQPVPVTAEIRKKRAASLYNIDEKLSIRTAHENPSLLKVYRDYFKGDLELIEQLMHCEYNEESRGGYRKI